jgi:Domain of unknown function (DUF4412)
MKRILCSLVFGLAALPATAGLTFDFTTTTNGSASGSQVMHAAVDARNVRLDVVNGDGVMFKDGSIAVSHDAGATLDVLDPQAKTYYELALDKLDAGAMLGGAIQLTNEKVSAKDAGNGGAINGYPTHHVVVTASGDLALGGTAAMHLDVTMETWTTDKVPPQYAAFLQHKAASTGLPVLDKLIAAQTNAAKGFPLKQVVSVKILSGGTPTIDMTQTTIVTNVHEKKLDAAMFAIPAGYARVKSPMEGLLRR